MITIPTGELVGLLSDVIPMASTDGDTPTINAVHLHWDGEMLHAKATDRQHIGWSMWHPDDAPVQDKQGDLLNQWGGSDESWSATICLPDAKHLVKTYKLGGKQWFIPLTVEHTSAGVRIVRSRDTGHSAISTVVRDTFEEFPKLDKALDESRATRNVAALAFNAKSLAVFAKVRPRGDMEMRFGGPTGLVHIRIGDRFRGGIQPVYNERLGEAKVDNAAAKTKEEAAP